jgi:hypothetical protein
LKQAVKQLEVMADGHRYFLLDRGASDSFAYSEAARKEEITEVEAMLIEALKLWTREYNDIIFVKNKGNEILEADGVRDTNINYAKKIEYFFENMLIDEFKDRLRVITYGDMPENNVRVGDEGIIYSNNEQQYYELVN